MKRRDVILSSMLFSALCVVELSPTALATDNTPSQTLDEPVLILTNPEYEVHAYLLGTVNGKGAFLAPEIVNGVARCPSSWTLDEPVAANSTLNTFYLNFYHTPTDPNVSIIPLSGDLPTPEFIAKMNATLKPFMASCSNIKKVVISHTLKEARKDPMFGFSYDYTLRSGVLELRGRKSVSYKGQPVTLASYRDMRQRRTDSRKFHLAENRKPGIVYKLDKYWKVDAGEAFGTHVAAIARNVFDGDFKRAYRDDDEFKSVFHDFGSLYSEKCRAQVKEFEHYTFPVRKYVRSETSFNKTTDYYDERMESVDIDKRFIPQWSNYGPVEQFGATKDKYKPGVKATSARFVREFFDMHNCTSAMMTQMAENLLRAANNRPSLQAEGVRLQGAEQESDPVFK